MGDIMYTVESINEILVKLEDRKYNTTFSVEKDTLPSDIKEGDILDIKDNKFVINKELTNETKERIKNKFESLMN